VSIPIDHFRVLEVEEPGALHQDSRSHEVRNSESMKSFVGSQSFAERIGVRHFGIFEDKRLGFFVPEFPKSRNTIQLWRRTRPKISAFRHFGFRWVEEPETRQQKSRNRETRSPDLEKGTIILLRSGDLSDALCLITWGILIRTCGYTVVCVRDSLWGKSKSQSDSGGKI
jgi:hypothetical protein